MRHVVPATLLLLASTAAFPIFAQDQTLAQDQTPAQGQTQIDALYDALQLNGVLEIMREEGLAHGADLADDMFPGRGGASWMRAVEEIYTSAAMEDVVRDRLADSLGDADLDPLLTFFTSPQGQRITTLEVEARRALTDEATEEAAEAALERMRADADPRLPRITAFIEANDLIEQNVVGGMNANYAFYIGLSDGGAFGDSLTEEQILTDVWGQEAELRDDTVDWLYSYLNLAYQPLEDGDLEAYIALSETPVGQELNRALFAAFDGMYVDISRDLGRQVAYFMAAQEL